MLEVYVREGAKLVCCEDGLEEEAGGHHSEDSASFLDFRERLRLDLPPRRLRRHLPALRPLFRPLRPLFRPLRRRPPCRRRLRRRLPLEGENVSGYER